MAGEVLPVVIHFGLAEQPLNRKLRGYLGAMADARAWFNRRLNGRTFDFKAPTAVDATRFGKSLADFQRDVWGSALGTATEAGLPVWKDNQLVAILVDEIAHTQPGLGGASPTPINGAMVKDGDALEVYAKKHAGEPVDEHNYSQNVAMLVHELLHAMHANDHEDVDGPNVEHEWWEGLVVDLAPVNRVKLMSSIWMSATTQESSSSSSADADASYRQGVRDTLDSLQGWIEERRRG
jgi:hypothetical protein